MNGYNVRNGNVDVEKILKEKNRTLNSKNTFGRAFVSVKIVFGKLQNVVVVVLQRVDVRLLLYVFHLLQFLLHPEFPSLIPFRVLGKPVVVLPIRALQRIEFDRVIRPRLNSLRGEKHS